jgi:hypothetical protein
MELNEQELDELLLALAAKNPKLLLNAAKEAEKVKRPRMVVFGRVFTEVIKNIHCIHCGEITTMTQYLNPEEEVTTINKDGDPVTIKLIKEPGVVNIECWCSYCDHCWDYIDNKMSMWDLKIAYKNLLKKSSHLLLRDNKELARRYAVPPNGVPAKWEPIEDCLLCIMYDEEVVKCRRNGECPYKEDKKEEAL